MTDLVTCLWRWFLEHVLRQRVAAVTVHTQQLGGGFPVGFTMTFMFVTWPWCRRVRQTWWPSSHHSVSAIVLTFLRPVQLSVKLDEYQSVLDYSDVPTRRGKNCVTISLRNTPVHLAPDHSLTVEVTT